MGVRVDRDVTAFGGEHAIRLSNGEVEVLASTDYGPRILRYAFREHENVFGFVAPAEESYATPYGEAWHPYGGHRLWHAPEHPVRTYIPDNSPVRADIDDEDNSLLLSQGAEKPTGLAKALRVVLSERGSRVVVTHWIRNVGDGPVDLAPWAVSLMAPGGTALLPNPPFAPHPAALLPSARLVTWPYTTLADPRFRFGWGFVRVTQDPTASSPQKIGLLDTHNGWAAYSRGDTLFVKRYPLATPDAPLVDLGCNVELFTNARFLELETLGPVTTLAPGDMVEHVETWELFERMAIPDDDEATGKVLADALDDPRLNRI